MAQLLSSGGDCRIALDADSGRNAYGCMPSVVADCLEFGSSTASHLSPRGLSAASQLRQQLLQALDQGQPALAVYKAALASQRQELLALYGEIEGNEGSGGNREEITQAKNNPRTGPSSNTASELIFASSGSELHLLAAQLVAAQAIQTTRNSQESGKQQALSILCIDANETGSLVPAALRGLHFGRHAPAENGQPIIHAADQIQHQATPHNLTNIAVRDSTGQPRPNSAIDAEFTAQARAALASSQQLLLIVADQSKSGLRVPTAACVHALQQEFGARLHVLVDACQLRLAPDSVRNWLQAGCLVAITGSKFFGGPSFSGALLLPAALATRYRKHLHTLPPALAAYSSQANWPARWPSSTLADSSNFGLLLRWEAALAEMRAFHRLPPSHVHNILKACAHTIHRQLARSARLTALPSALPDAAPGTTLSHSQTARWDACQSIFPFLLHHADGHPLPPAAANQLQRELLQGQHGHPACQLGQAITCAQHQGDPNHPIAALRLSLSARQLTNAAHSPQALNTLQQHIVQALQQVESALSLSLRAG